MRDYFARPEVIARRRVYEENRQIVVYGADWEDVARLYEAQHGKCPGCRRSLNWSECAIDHCHATGVVRGLLCRHCNIALGHIRDDVATLRRLIEYVSSSGTPRVITHGP